MTLKVIGSGFGRTGTMSLKCALEELGYGPCHHMEEVFAHPEQVAHWQALAAGRPVIWDEVFAGYNSQVDWPGAHVWRETAAAYPKAMVIHTMRPEELWWQSFSTTIAKLMDEYKNIPLPPHGRDMPDAFMVFAAPKTFGGRHADKDAAIAAYRRRAEEVRAAIPPSWPQSPQDTLPKHEFERILLESGQGRSALIGAISRAPGFLLVPAADQEHDERNPETRRDPRCRRRRIQPDDRRRRRPHACPPPGAPQRSHRPDDLRA